MQLYKDAGKDRKFEIVLFGYDRSQDGVEKYLMDSSIPFPCVNKADMGDVKDLAELGKTGYIPNMVLVNPDGTMVTNDRDKVLAKLKGE